MVQRLLKLFYISNDAVFVLSSTTQATNLSSLHMHCSNMMKYEPPQDPGLRLSYTSSTPRSYIWIPFITIPCQHPKASFHWNATSWVNLIKYQPAHLVLQFCSQILGRNGFLKVENGEWWSLRDCLGKLNIVALSEPSFHVIMIQKKQPQQLRVRQSRNNNSNLHTYAASISDAGEH